MNLDEIRDYITKIAQASGISSNAEWAVLAGLDVGKVEAFLSGGDIGLADFVTLSKAAGASVVPMLDSKLDEAVMLLEDEGILAEGVYDPSAKYRNM